MAKGPFIEYLRMRVEDSAAHIWTTIEVPVPTSRTEFMAMLIHWVYFHVARIVPVDGIDCAYALLLMSEDEAAVPTPMNSAFIAEAERRMDAGSVSGTLTDYVSEYWAKPMRWDFDPPLLYTKKNIYLGSMNTGAAATHVGCAIVGYTLEKVSQADFIAALVE